MFSPSLISFLLHSIPPNSGALSGYVFPKLGDLASHMTSRPVVPPHYTGPPITLPITGRTTSETDLKQWFQSYVREDATDSARYFWGRIPIDLLIRYFAEFRYRSADQEYIDIAPGLLAPSSIATGRPSVYDAQIAALLSRSQTRPGGPGVRAAIVDFGEAIALSPMTYNGCLQHAVTHGIEMSEHARMVLAVLLERLDHDNVLAETAVCCALVAPVPSNVHPGFGCFAQSSIVEMQDALAALDTMLTDDSLPLAVNLSLGTHVGPHNGDSPLEAYIRDKFTIPQRRFTIVAAGNGGENGPSAKRDLLGGERDILCLRVSPRCTELLVEFWWDDTVDKDLVIEADIFERLTTGGLGQRGNISIGPGISAINGATPQAGQVGLLAQARGSGLPSHLVSHSLVSDKCPNNMRCVAFAMTTTNTSLPPLYVRFGLVCSTDVTVNAWIVAGEKSPSSDTAFVAGGQQSTLMVPATAPWVVSVGGIEANNQVWDGSSRGPAAYYSTGVPSESSPLMAHLARFNGEAGTSLASPRACADTVAALAEYRTRVECTDAKGVLCAAYNLDRAHLPRWNPRTGYHKAQ